MNKDNIPESLFIADAKTKIKIIMENLSPAVAELLFSDAHNKASIAAQRELEKDYKTFEAQNKTEKEVEDNGIQSTSVHPVK